MHISDHYTPFEKKTLIVVTNNEKARLFKAEDRDVEEIELVSSPETAETDRVTEIDVDFDQMKINRLKELYHALSKRLLEMIDHEGYETIVACVPEVNKTHFASDMHTDVLKHISETIPKNLASMDINNIVRILVEG
ncbi:MAG: hypothetical protein WC813_04565 [Patescibacteria group bacterium]|jgi:hypothetical protein